ncbi:sensor histidine kinase [Faecalicatena orotica]|uniref:Two-component system sensor histidine kinase YesM n=1 Tax=Faecalicatena orotica TaxID=1544 RepID=A0A2Y9CA72_9FIRM|nr:sensor histidine kinase [Faecalicatena orotica]PWJ28594.1 two-component system sensor histidine kinase YesM [Faecalicatena orotica]SSA56415.1 two-component system, sensor histidine kinase YesM [Faecalicatena orotica]
MVKNLLNKWRHFAFRKQIVYVYGLSVLCIILFFLIFYFGITIKYANKEMETNLKVEWLKIENALNNAVEKAEGYSKLMESVDEIQAFLNNPKETQLKEDLDQSILSGILLNSDIDAIYIYDLEGNYYHKTRGQTYTPIMNSVQEASWYHTVYAKKGKSSVYFGGGGFFEGKEDGFLSVVSLIKEPATSLPKGVMICNISIDQILKPIKSSSVYCSIMDGLKNVYYISEPIERLKEGQEYKRIYGPAAITVSIAMDKAVVHDQYKVFNIGLLAILIIYTIFIFLCMSVLDNSIAKPLSHVLKVMEKNQLQEIDVLETNQDMISLQTGFNHMIQRTVSLLRQIEGEQKQKRQYELKVLNAQVRPHFLYNTFDSVCALALMGKSKDVYLLMQALGKYYRISLHKGDETIRLKEEIEIIKNYIVIQKYRFEDFFEIEYRIPDDLNELKVLKLILQPFIENAIYHGLKTKGGGKITIAAEMEDGYLVLRIKDSGMGMSEDAIQRILNGEVNGEEKSFGIYGTAERITLHYGQENLVHIYSEPGLYTTIEIRIPKEQGE